MSEIVVVGEGLLADYVCGKLSAQYEVIHRNDFVGDIPETAKIVLVLHDTWNPSAHLKAEEVLRPLGISWLRGYISFGEGVIGPIVHPEKQGCSQCANKRRLMADRNRREMWEIEQRLSKHGGKSRDPWASRTGLLQMAYVLKVEVQSFLRGNLPHSEGKVCFINLRTLKSSWHSFLPNPLCSVCGQLPDDSQTAARITLKPSPKISFNNYRCRSIDELKKVLAIDYFDERMGLFNGKMFDLEPPFADVGVNLPLFSGDEGVGGRTHSYAVSELTAILEGLERNCGLSPSGKRTVVRDKFSNLSHQALDPTQVGLHAKEQYLLPDFPFTEFNPDSLFDWVWGYSFLQERPILVPELLAYYSLGCGQGFIYETSNGCAVGGSLEEAIFYGIMEVVERDSFLLTWYAQLPLPRLDPFSANDQELQLMIDRVRTVAGYELYFYNSTMENGIPSVLTIAKNKKQKGMNLICAAGAHLDPIRAAKSAVHELAGMMLTLDKTFEANKEKYEEMLHDSSLVRKMDDHGMLYGLPQAEERLQFLLENNRPWRSFDEEYKWSSRHADLTDDLKDVLQVFRHLNQDVIVVDQTTPETKRNGLYCVKVIIPGMLPMTFGHHLTRLTGLERVLKVPMELGYEEQPLAPERVNPFPHPFP